MSAPAEERGTQADAGVGPEHATLAAANRQIALRQVNEEIRRFAENSGLPELDLFCECERVDCLDRLSVQIDDYEAVRRFPTHFVVRPAHLDAEDRIIEETPEYVVIEKVGPDAAVAISQDPRRASIRRLT